MEVSTSEEEISQNFVAFSEYMNFNTSPAQILPPKAVDRRPELLVLEYVDGQAKANTDNPGGEEIKIEIEAVDSEDDLSAGAVRNPVLKFYGPQFYGPLPTAKRPKLSLNEGDVLEKNN